MQSPSPQQVRELRERHGLNQPLLAQLVHVSLRAVQFWEAPATVISRRMPPGLYELALIKLGESPLSHGYQALVFPKPEEKAPKAKRLRRRKAAKVTRPPMSPERLAALRALAARSLSLSPKI